MKKIIPLIAIILVAAIAVFGFIYYNNNFANNDNNQGSSSKNVSATGKDKNEEKDLAKKVNSKGKDTLLIYMVGSDLESRSGAGTDDLREIEESGIDLKKANVLVYAGGSQKWHNDNVYEGKNTVLQLGKKGFEPVAKMESSNMGDSSSLLEFLNYSCENYPSDSYSLIMWDHGNGPIIGYGKDMLFDNDSLTLLEMDKALKASPFGNGKKLEWVGFDACLMSSAELVCIWDNYAKYLIASQEVEPSFGWNYGFLKDFAKVDTTTLAKNIVDQYIGACTAYYQKRGYDDRDTTLACMNLAYANELESAINGLFAKADEDVYTQYNTLVSKRVDTRALGRASTGSEYDLIDLNDMAEQLSEVYPDETKKISDVIKKIVIKNGTNTQGCCGLSLYYPFYNKYYYEDSWGDAYGNIGLFSNYKSYLNKYQEIWLKDDKLDKYASSNTPVEDDTRSGFEFDMPEKVVSKKYNLQLTKEQNENYAEAKFYILKKMGDELYHTMFSSNDVSNNNGVLTANFEGKGIYVKNKYNDYFLPVAKGYDTVGDIARYSIQSYGTNNDSITKDESSKFQILQFQISLNNKTGKVNIQSLSPYVGNDEMSYIGGGKLNEQDIASWQKINFAHINYLFLQRYENGAIKPLDKWIKNPAASAYDFSTKENIEFVYSPLDDGEYYLIFEITDTQNNKYCSELLKVDVEAEEKPAYKPEDINIQWNKGKRIEVFRSNGACLYLKYEVSNGRPYYKLEAENNNDYAINYQFKDVIINGNIYYGYGDSLDVGSKETANSTFGINPSEEIKIGAINKITSISGVLSAYNKTEEYTIARNQTINISIEDDAIVDEFNSFYEQYDFKEEFYGAHASKQVIFNESSVEITLLEFGKAKNCSYPGYLCIENKASDGTVEVSMQGMSVNDITVAAGASRIQVPAGCKQYMPISSIEPQLAENNVTSIEKVDFAFGVWNDKDTWLGGPSDMIWVPVKLDVIGKEVIPFIESKNVIFNKNGIKITLNNFKMVSGYPQWNATVVNNSDLNINLYLTDDKNEYSNDYGFVGGTQVGAHQRRNIIISGRNEEVVDSISFRLHVQDFNGSKLLFSSEKMITLEANSGETTPERINVTWENGDSIVVYEQEGYSIFLKKIESGGKPAYTFELDNRNPYPVSFQIQNIILNDSVFISEGTYLSADAKQKQTSYIDFPHYPETNYGVLEEVNRITFILQDKSKYQLVNAVKDQVIDVTLLEDAMISNIKDLYKQYKFENPYMGSSASEQIVYNDDNIVIKFLGFGNCNDSSGTYGFCIDNKDSKIRTVSLEAMAINDVTMFSRKDFKIPPKCKSYYFNTVNDSELLQYGMSSINSMSFAFVFDEAKEAEKMKWLPIKLKEMTDKPYKIMKNDNVLFEQEGITVLLDSYKETTTSSEWNIIVINESNKNISLWGSNNDCTSTVAPMTDSKVGAHQKRMVKIIFNNKDIKEVVFKLHIKDFFGNKMLYQGEALIKINDKCEISKGE